MKWILPLCLIAPPAFAEVCPPVADHSSRLTEIVADLSVSRGEGEARVLTEELWTLWTDAPDDRAQAMLDEGMRQRSGFDFLGARDTLDELVQYCPDYAEGYNQRAFANYLRQDFSAALVDLDRALEIIPNHIAALSGKGLTLMGLGRHDEAQDALRAAVEMNPWLQERSLLVEPLGQDI
jgi:tetratricopeptide (TPR) repeat protein